MAETIGDGLLLARIDERTANMSAQLVKLLACIDAQETRIRELEEKQARQEEQSSMLARLQVVVSVVLASIAAYIGKQP